MRTETKTIVNEVAITKEERDFLAKIYQLATTVHAGETEFGYNFSTILDMVMSDLIDAEQYNDEFIADFSDYYT